MRERAGFRFRPPPGELSPELKAAVRSAFAPTAASPDDADPEAVWELAGALGLREAMAANLDRLPATVVAAALGDRLRQWRRMSVARDLLHEATARQVAAVANEERIPLLWLKGFALRAAGVHPPGRRALLDLDLLAPPHAAETLERRLLESGWRRRGDERNEQHLPPLQSPDGCLLDIHFRLRGVRLAGARWAEAEEILELPDTRPADDLAGTFLPEPDLLAAHLVVHAIAQHGHRPASYPLLRTIDDLTALLPSPQAWRRFASGRFVTIADAVSRRELDALTELTGALNSGELPQDSGRRDAYRLLLHAQAGATDPGYARSLRRRHLAGRIREAIAEGHLRSYLRRKLLSFR